MVNLKAGEGRISLNYTDICVLEKRERIQVGWRLRKVREHRGESIEEFSKIVHEETLLIRYFECGKMPPHHTYMETLCAATGANLEWIISGQGDMYVDPELQKKHFGTHDVAQALAWEISMMDEPDEFVSGRWGFGLPTPDETVKEAEKDMEKSLEDLATGQTDTDTALSKSISLEGACEMRGYENGMRYGARLVFQLLTGKTGTEAEEMLQAGLARLNMIPARTAPEPLP